MSAAAHEAAQPEVDAAAMRRDFLALLFDDVPGLIEVRPIAPDRGVRTDLRVFATSIEQAEQAAARADAAACMLAVDLDASVPVALPVCHACS